ncbi:MAG: PAS domain-containing protein [Pseudomonadota bacterium]|nr:PAS domain-containing protein [Pseudomonadota bacterium]
MLHLRTSDANRQPPAEGSYVPDPGLISFELDPALDFQAPLLRAGHDYWNRIRDGRDVPLRRSVDPLTMPPGLLSHVLLIDVVQAPKLRFRWRLIGTHVTEALGRDMTGAWWDDIYRPDVIAALSTGPLEALRTGRPVRTLGRAPLDSHSFMSSENMDAPLSSDGSAIDMIMVVTLFEGMG